QELLAELVELFAEDSPRLLSEIKQAVVRGEGVGLARAAHTLKGAASNFGAHGVVTLARRLEEAGRAERLAEADVIYVTLETEVERLNAALGALVDKGRVMAWG